MVSTESNLHPTSEELADATAEMLSVDAATDAMVPLPHEIVEREYKRELEKEEDLLWVMEESATVYQKDLWHRNYCKHYADELVDNDGDGDLSIGSSASEGVADANADADKMVVTTLSIVNVNA